MIQNKNQFPNQNMFKFQVTAFVRSNDYNKFWGKNNSKRKLQETEKAHSKVYCAHFNDICLVNSKRVCEIWNFYVIVSRSKTNQKKRIKITDIWFNQGRSCVCVCAA